MQPYLGRQLFLLVPAGSLCFFAFRSLGFLLFDVVRIDLSSLLLCHGHAQRSQIGEGVFSITFYSPLFHLNQIEL
jgi:hypothetical protein